MFGIRGVTGTEEPENAASIRKIRYQATQTVNSTYGMAGNFLRYVTRHSKQKLRMQLAHRDRAGAHAAHLLLCSNKSTLQPRFRAGASLTLCVIRTVDLTDAAEREKITSEEDGELWHRWNASGENNSPERWSDCGEKSRGRIAPEIAIAMAPRGERSRGRKEEQRDGGCENASRTREER
ncbi:hypothetical protein K0M31_016976 [Melipona bicolor]|uniref:Uncharacterized protein n=1 Tax=Melipona bicolor TaxID=60889 RepID=A0AA40FEH7_9HYME|nr:hypothetical protein K0M31_016976 [Melipona bicolor]